MASPPLVIGIGNEYCGDDGAGLAVVRALQARKRAHVRFLECDGNCTTLLEAWKDADDVILIDAVASGARPGTMYRIDACTQTLPARCTFFSTHAFGIAETLTLARALGQLPARFLIYGIEGERFAAAEGFSPPVKQAIEKVTGQVLLDLSGRHARRGPRQEKSHG